MAHAIKTQLTKTPAFRFYYLSIATGCSLSIWLIAHISSILHHLAAFRFDLYQAATHAIQQFIHS